MAVQILLNLILSVFWLFVTGSYTLNNFILGYLFALILVYLMRGIPVSYTHLTLPTSDQV